MSRGDRREVKEEQAYEREKEEGDETRQVLIKKALAALKCKGENAEEV
jgi:hypothetical protein